jgi:Uma2 family endonuclease
MASKTLFTVEDYAALEESPGERFELSHGELIVTPSSSHRHNDLRDRLNVRLRNFPGFEKLVDLSSETDVLLATDIVRRPDICLFRAGRLNDIDLDLVPLPVAPDLVIEIVSRTDRADDLLLKVQQYLRACAQAVWLLYPATRLAYRYLSGKRGPEVLSAETEDSFQEPGLLPGFSLRLGEIF